MKKNQTQKLSTLISVLFLSLTSQFSFAGGVDGLTNGVNKLIEICNYISIGGAVLTLMLAGFIIMSGSRYGFSDFGKWFIGFAFIMFAPQFVSVIAS